MTLATFLVSLLYALAPLEACAENIAKNAHDRARMEKIMVDVIAVRPNSAVDYYIYSQILNEAGKHSEAIKELEKAKSLDPKLTFTSASRLAEYEALLAKGPMIVEDKPEANSDSLPVSQPSAWNLRRPLQLTICLILIGLVVSFIRFVRSSPQTKRNLRLFSNPSLTYFRAR
jgi:tetratricopeptide (TPR) repeat protein